jgi:two-component system, sporulation sensor kinase E
MKKFIERALERLPKLDEEQIRSLINRLGADNDLLGVVLDSMTDGLVVLSGEHDIMLFNKAAERLLPFGPEDIIEKKLWDVVADREIAGFFEDSLRSQDRVYDKQFTLDISGGIRILSCSIMPLVDSGKALGNLVHIEDVTEKRSKEARLRRAESLASLTTLTAGVAHEIKNPLGSIGIHIQLIQKAIEAGKRFDKKSISRYLEIVMEEVERLNGIVVDFLFAVRPMNAELERRSLNVLVHDILEFIQYELKDAGIDVEEQYSDSIPDLDLDEKYVKQALLNILKNAIAAMPNGGNLRVSTEMDSNDVSLRISDTGVGIKEENIEKIFEPYFTTKEFGSGLGLTVVYKIVKEHGGEISLSSGEGEGTTFTFSFPIPESERRLIEWEELKA